MEWRQAGCFPLVLLCANIPSRHWHRQASGRAFAPRSRCVHKPFAAGQPAAGPAQLFQCRPALAGSFARRIESGAPFQCRGAAVTRAASVAPFCRLKHRQRTPDVRMLSEFRAQAGVAALRRINEHLVQQLLAFLPAGGRTVALGLLPLNTIVARRLLNQTRSWAEPSQAYEKTSSDSTRCF